MFTSPQPNSRPQPPLVAPEDRSSNDLAPGNPLDLRDLIALAEAPSHLPRRPDGKKVHRTTVGRWSSRGCAGVILKSWWIGGHRFTSRQALAEFCECLTALKSGGRGSAPSAPAVARGQAQPSLPIEGSASRRDRIEADLERFGL